MKDKLFVIAIGGTGMRCLESFVHLCAVGMFDNEEINILTLDTDHDNGNKGRVERLIDKYNKVKTDSAASPGGSPNTNTFFSAKLNLYRFFTNYSDANRDSYQDIITMTNVSEDVKAENRELADLFLDHDTVQSFNLAHGYRAQTHLGSMLMYHGIIEAACHYAANKDEAQDQEKALVDFITELQKSGNGARVFVFGSIFGGTGASSIPVIPEALKEAASIISKNTIDYSKVKFGATLLTKYFHFNPASDDEKKTEKLIASSDYFDINSQAALQFYQNDNTVKECYKRFYHIGWPMSALDVSNGSGSKVKTGGAEQTNDCHVVELLSACAAYDFLTIDEKKLQIKEAQYLYRSVGLDASDTLVFRGTDFVNENKADVFIQKIGSFLTLSHIVLSMNGGNSILEGDKSMRGTRGFIKRLSQQDVKDYDSMGSAQCETIDDYMREFAYSVVNNSLIRGWLYQIYFSVHMIGVNQFLFPPQVFEENVAMLGNEKFDPCKLIQEEKREGFFNRDVRKTYEDFIKNLPKCLPDSNQNVSTLKERFLAHMYNAINTTIPFSVKL